MGWWSGRPASSFGRDGGGERRGADVDAAGHAVCNGVENIDTIARGVDQIELGPRFIQHDVGRGVAELDDLAGRRWLRSGHQAERQGSDKPLLKQPLRHGRASGVGIITRGRGPSCIIHNVWRYSVL